jgi:hypothetical protein
MDATKTQSGTLDRHLLSAKKYTCQRGAEPGRHHLVIPGDIISERPGDFVGIRNLTVAETADKLCSTYPERSGALQDEPAYRVAVFSEARLNRC